MPEKKLFERLPKSVRPTHYDLTLKPNLKSFTFAGEETIKVHVAKATRTIILNTLELEIPSAKFITADGSKIACENIELSKEDETATLTFPAELPEGEGQLCIEFLGVLNDKLKGFYRSKYTADGGVQYGAVTQFEATDARRAFPCWDEPASKATFDITLVVPNDRVALSNMNVIATTPLEGDTNLKVVKFATTPVMSTYLVACIVGEYDYVEGKSADGILVRVYTPVGKKDQGLFALDVAVKVLPYYKDYFNIPYPLPKIDLIAIADFASGAMENWGLVTYRESCLLVDPHNTSAAKKQWIALVVGHELAHQWFGNLVTMEWWTHLWLNEGFASWIEFLCVDYLFPQYQIWTQFVTDTHSRALELDALRNSHPIEVPVGHPAEVDEIFDDISYNKGASVIRMLHNYIGDECFRKGMNQYLTKHQYKNTFTEDLWECLESASNKPIGTMMSTWTKQTGFPVIKVVARQDGTSRILQITQERFIADGSSDLENSQWIVPINISTSQNPDKILKQITLQNKSMEVVIENVNPDEWVKLNPGTVGFYRVQYSPEMLETFHSAIRDKTLPPLDRLGLLDDLFALVQAGHISTVEVLKLMQNYATEDNYTVWAALCNCLGRLSTLLSHTDYRSSFMAYSCGLMGSITNRLGWDPEKDENHLHTLLRGLVLDRMGLYGDAAVIVEAKRRFESHAAGSSILCADLRSPVYRTVLSVGDEKTFDSMLRLYREADLHEEKDRISRALGSLQEVSLIRRVLDFAMSEEVRSQDTVFVIISVAMNPCGRDMAWQFFREKWEELISRYQGGFLISRLVKYITENFASEEKAQEVERFFAENSVAAAERTVQQSIENIRLNANWLSRDSASIKSWLQDRK